MKEAQANLLTTKTRMNYERRTIKVASAGQPNIDMENSYTVTLWVV